MKLNKIPSVLWSITILFAVSTVSPLKTPHQLKGRDVMRLDQALNKSLSIGCDDANFIDTDKSTAEYRWNASGASDVLHAIALHWGESGDYKTNPSLAQYVGKLAGVDPTNFTCDDLRSENSCTFYQSKCNPSLGPAFDEILRSMSNYHKYYKYVTQNALAKGADEAAFKAYDLSLNAVEYKSPDAQAKADVVMGIMGLILLPVGGAATIEQYMKQAIEKATIKASEAVANKLKTLGYQNNIMSIESGSMAVESLIHGKNPIADFMGYLEEIDTFTKLGEETLDLWKSGVENATVKMFKGNMSVDESLGEFGNFAGLLHTFENGAWVDEFMPADEEKLALSQYLAYALPIAETMNDDVRPTIIMRPYKCDDQNRKGADKTFQELIHGLSDIETSFDDAPGICFYVVDANKKPPEPGSRGHLQPYVSRMKGINSQTMSSKNGDGSLSWGDIHFENYVRSSYMGWKQNGKSNINIPRINVTLESVDRADNIWDRPLDAPGQWNSFFIVCGTDDPTSSLDGTQNDVDLILRNLVSAYQHPDWADRNKRPYPCAENPPSKISRA